MNINELDLNNNHIAASKEDVKPTKNPFLINKKGAIIGALAAALSYAFCFEHLEREAYLSVAVAALFWIAFAVRLKDDVKSSEIIKMLFFLSTPFVCFYFVEFLNDNSVFDDLTFLQGLLNVVWYSIFLFISYVIFRRKTPAVLFCVFLCVFIGVVNHYVLSFRGTVLFPCDIFCMETAINVADNFNYRPDDKMQYVFMLMVLFYLYNILWCHKWKKDVIRKKLIMSLGAFCVVYIGVFFYTDTLGAIGIYAQQWKTQANGFLLNFTAAMKYSIVTEPEGYSLDFVNKMAEEIQPENTLASAISNSDERPENVIVIMNESFSDFSIFENFECSEDPMPFYHSLKENTVKGHTYVSVSGGGTANSEFEFLTGNSLVFLPQSTVAYQLYFNENTPSVVDQFNDLGYTTVAFHPYIASGWNRPLVYEWMGFDKQIFRDDMESAQIIRKYISDTSDYNQIYSLTEETEGPLFVFNVTMQNHSSYNVKWDDIEEPIYAEGKFAGKSYTSSLNQYLSLMRVSDNALRDLIEHYSNVDEKTMIVFFGDHQPPLSNDFYEDLYGKSLDERTAQEVMMQYETPFFIWTNYDMPSEDNVEISLNYLLIEVLERANIPLTKYQTFLSGIEDEFPVINRVGFKTEYGKYYEYEQEEDLPENYEDIIRQYEYLQYNNIFDNDNMPEGFFTY